MTDYNKVLRSFIKFQKEAGWHLVSATDGEDRFNLGQYTSDRPFATAAAEWATAAEEGTLSFTRDGHRITAYTIIGNEASATIYDFGHADDIPSGILKDFDDAWTAWMNKWDELEA